MKTKAVAIIGAGFSGSLTAINLARSKATLPLRIYLIERAGSFGPGLAYSPPTDRFKLNVRAKAMGAFPDDPEGFFRWLKARDPLATPDDFAPRARYGEYLKELLEIAAADPCNNPIHLVKDEVTDISFDASTSTFVVTLAKSAPLTVDACALAIGNLMKASPNDQRANDLLREPFKMSSYTDIEGLSSLLIIGSGLTAIDVIMESEAQGFKGHYTVVSRHGRFPRAHESSPLPTNVSLPPQWERLDSVSKLLKLVRAEARRATSSQPVIDAMRPNLQEMWRNLSLRERRRFLRHVKPFWEIHRHRTPVEHAHTIEHLRGMGRLTLLSGRVAKLERSGSELLATITPRGAHIAPHTISANAAFLCAGTEGDLSRADHPLVRNLVTKGLIAPGPLCLGALSSPRDETLKSGLNMWIIGPLQREALWEVTAVRELREQSVIVAKDIITALSH